MVATTPRSTADVEVLLPWGAWFQDTLHALRLPGSWETDVLQPADRQGMTREAIDAALENPIGGPGLREIASRGRTACIVVDDLARPTRAYEVLPRLLEQLQEGAIRREDITIVVATGTHGPLNAEQINWKIGRQIASDYRVEVHQAGGDLVATGIPYGKGELKLNRAFFEADVKLGIGSVLPHSFAGYSGGAKLMLPGLADVQSTARSHKFVEMGLRRGNCAPNENRFRLEIERLAAAVGFQYTVCVIPNRRRETVGIFAGDIVAAHREACHAAAACYATPVSATYDLLVLNAYPKDTDLIQAQNVMVALKGVKRPIVHESGVILITTAATEGLGRHGLFAPDGCSYRPPQSHRALGSRKLWIYAPNVAPHEARQLYWKDYPIFSEPLSLHNAMAARFDSATRAAILPSAPLQQLHDDKPSV